ncbi:MAG: hydrolase [Candidatus Parcubacteria bacterium]|nr:MAG: hydrolase [Candidatus Parcubacteria bacterium]
MKEKLIILPGWREKVESFSELKELLKEIETEIVPLPGFQEKLNQPYTFQDYLNYLEEKLKNFENFYLLGHSFGGALSLLLAIKNPEKIKKLILYNAAIVREKNLKKKIISSLVKILKPCEKILPQKLIFFLKKFFYRFIVKSYDYFLIDENLKKTFANINQDLREKAKFLNTKTILLWGKNDKITPLKHALILKDIIKEANLIIIEGGHSPHKENPEKFAKILTEIIFAK